MSKYTKYLGIPHSYNKINCITLIEFIYKRELKSNIFSSLWVYLDIKSKDGKAYLKGKELTGTKWTFEVTFDELLDWCKDHAQKVDLTDLQEYDVILFKSSKNRPIHFGMYVGEGKFIHIEEKHKSEINFFGANWREKTHSIWRRKKDEMV